MSSTQTGTTKLLLEIHRHTAVITINNPRQYLGRREPARAEKHGGSAER